MLLLLFVQWLSSFLLLLLLDLWSSQRTLGIRIPPALVLAVVEGQVMVWLVSLVDKGVFQ